MLPPQIRRSPGAQARTASTTTTVDAHKYNAGADRFRRAWSRQFFSECGCSVPCRCEYHEKPTQKRIDGYRAAVEHLEHHGLPAALFTPEARELWKRGGDERALVEKLRAKAVR